MHWLGYPDCDDKWVHEGHIDAKELIEGYLQELEGELVMLRIHEAKKVTG